MGGSPQGGPAPLVLFRVAWLRQATAPKHRRQERPAWMGGSPQGGPAPLVLSHAAAPAASSSPSRALLKAVMATSSMSSEGSRVVNFWVPSTGSRATLITGLVRLRAMKRISSKPTPAVSGIASSRETTSQNKFG